MAVLRNTPPFPVDGSYNQELGITYLRIKTSPSGAPAAPSKVINGGGLIASTGRDGTGSLQLNLNPKFKYVDAFCNVYDTSDTFVNVDSVTEGLTSAAVLNLTVQQGGSATDLDEVEIGILVVHVRRAEQAA